MKEKKQSSKVTTPSLTGRVRGGSVFRRFSRAGYAIFSSLHREVRIGVLTVGMLASVNIPKVQAMGSMIPVSGSAIHLTDDEEVDEKELAEVSVAGTMSPLTALQSARIVGVITRQQIEASAAQSVNDLLKLAVGVDVRQRGGFGIQTDISINGGTFDQITLLLNGVNISSPHTGHLAADFPVSLADIERIEILEGAASRVYGASAFGGAINIVTKGRAREGADTKKKNQLFSVEAGAQGGSYATFGGDARLSVHSIPSITLSAEYIRSNGATVNSDFARGNAYLRGFYDHPDFVIDCQASYSQKSYGANTFYSAAYPNQYERNTRFIFSAGAETKGRVRLRPEVYWNRLYDNFELIRGTTTGENFHRTDVHGARITADVRWLLGRTALGAEIREEGIYSTSLGRPLTTQGPSIPSSSDNYTRHDSRTNLSFNVEHNILLPRFTASFGLLAFSSHPSTLNSHPSTLKIYPGIDLAVTPAPHWRLFASYNKGFRLPTFTDLYYKSPTHEGNLGMKAEESHSFQLGTNANYNSSLFTLHSSFKLFYHRGHNLIDWVMYSADDVFHSANFNLDNMGVQADAEVSLNPLNPSNSSNSSTLNSPLGPKGRLTLQELSTLNSQPITLHLSYAFIHQRRHDDQFVYKSNYAMEYLRHKFVARLDHPLFSLPSRRPHTSTLNPHPSSLSPHPSRLSASWTLRWQDRMGSYIRYENAQSTGELVPYKPYATLDLKIRWTAPHYEVWAEGTNLFNRRYYDLGNIPQPGIVILAGARVKW